jgi:hypothetical protein
VSEIMRWVPSPERMHALGLSARDMPGYAARSRIERRAQAPLRHSDPLLDLLARYECGAYGVALIELLAAPVRDRLGTQFASWESDPIVLRPTGEIVLAGHLEDDAVQMRCAENSAHFLDALAFLAGAYAHRDDWAGREAECPTECARRAGGPANLAFWRTLMFWPD